MSCFFFFFFFFLVFSLNEKKEIKKYKSQVKTVMLFFFFFFFSDLSQSQTNEKGHGSQLSISVDLFSRAVSCFFVVFF